MKEWIRQGMTPGEIALTVGTGVGLGIFPVLGISSVFCAYVAYRFRLNHLLIQAVNYLSLPLQLLLLIPFARLGEELFRVRAATPYSLGEMLEILMSQPERFLGFFLSAILCAVGAWFLTVFPFIVASLFLRLRDLPALESQNIVNIEMETLHPRKSRNS